MEPEAESAVRVDSELEVDEGAGPGSSVPRPLPVVSHHDDPAQSPNPDGVLPTATPDPVPVERKAVVTFNSHQSEEPSITLEGPISPLGRRGSLGSARRVTSGPNPAPAAHSGVDQVRQLVHSEIVARIRGSDDQENGLPARLVSQDNFVIKTWMSVAMFVAKGLNSASFLTLFVGGILPWSVTCFWLPLSYQVGLRNFAVKAVDNDGGFDLVCA